MNNIEKTLQKIGAFQRYKGYSYLIYAIELVLAEPTFLTAILKELYPEIARKFNCSAQSVEKNIRTFICIAWEHGNRQAFYQIAGYEIKYKPSNAEFIDILTNYIK